VVLVWVPDLRGPVPLAAKQEASVAGGGFTPTTPGRCAGQGWVSAGTQLMRTRARWPAAGAVAGGGPRHRGDLRSGGPGDGIRMLR
jgi:hypothetical protein